MPLTDKAVKNAKRNPKKTWKLWDEKGSYLEIPNRETESFRWRWKYRFGGKEKRLSLGTYPDVSLKEHRIKRDKEREILASGKDPGVERKAEKRVKRMRAAHTYEAIGREWWTVKSPAWSASYRQATLARLVKQLFPDLGPRPIAEIEPPELLDVIRSIERRGALEVASKCLVTAGQVFRYAIVTGRAKRDPTRDLRGALQARDRRHYAALKRADLPEFLQKLDTYDGNELTKLAIRLLMLTFVRTAELRGATWSEFDVDRAEWRIPPERMKMREQHIVPLSTQALAVIEALRPLSEHRPFVFPSEHHPGTKSLSENTILYALYRMGYRGRATGHGFRATASTILNEAGFKADVIERQLAHAERNKVRGAYNHAEYLPERRKMMQTWADMLDTFAKGADVIPIRSNAA